MRRGEVVAAFRSRRRGADGGNGGTSEVVESGNQERSEKKVCVTGLGVGIAAKQIPQLALHCSLKV